MMASSFVLISLSFIIGYLTLGVVKFFFEINDSIIMAIGVVLGWSMSILMGKIEVLIGVIFETIGTKIKNYIKK